LRSICCHGKQECRTTCSANMEFKIVKKKCLELWICERGGASAGPRRCDSPSLTFKIREHDEWVDAALLLVVGNMTKHCAVGS
jgi:hypothetical protein